MEQTTEQYKKSKGGFVGPADLPPLQPQPAQTPPPPPPPPPPIWKKALILSSIAIATIIIMVLVILHLKNEKNQDVETTPAPQPQETIEPYNHGFYIKKTQARLFKKEFSGVYADRNMLYDQVFNQAAGNADWDSIAPIANLESIPLESMKSSVLVFALSYGQNEVVNAETESKMVLTGLPAGPAESASVFSSLPESGVIYLPLEELVPEAAQWMPGNYHFTFLLNAKLAYECDFTVVK